MHARRQWTPADRSGHTSGALQPPIEVAHAPRATLRLELGGEECTASHTGGDAGPVLSAAQAAARATKHATSPSSALNAVSSSQPRRRSFSWPARQRP